MKINVNVTKACIKKARLQIRKNKQETAFAYAGKCCPIAQALSRKKVKFKLVSATHLKMTRGRIFNLPQKAIDFIKRFDEGSRVSPFKFSINIPEKYISTK